MLSGVLLLLSAYIHVTRGHVLADIVGTRMVPFYYVLRQAQTLPFQPLVLLSAVHSVQVR